MKAIQMKTLAAFALAFTTVLLLLSAAQSKPAATKAIASTAPIPPGTIIPDAQDFLGAITNGVKLPASTPYDAQPDLKQFYLKGFCKGYHLTITNRAPEMRIQMPGYATQPQPAYEIAADKGFLDGQTAGYHDREPVPVKVQLIMHTL